MAENSWNQKSLLPKLLKKGDASYDAVIDLQEALEDDDKCNIALTGPFGAGKSSVVRTLKHNNKDNSKWDFLTISLATLDAVNNDYSGEISKTKNDKNKLDNEILNRRIEYSILQQLIYREKRKILPNSRLKRIPYISPRTIKDIALKTILFVICFCIVFEPQWCRVEILYRLFDWGYWINGVFDIVALIVMGYMLFHCIKNLIVFSGNARLNQVKIAGSEIKIEDENSIFNHHLDEILYFFQCTTYNVVIIEDLDRFNTTDIFLKLRELNYLLNQSKIVGRKIKFIYAIKDDMFTDSSRTKFFDYITTVIPVISPYNSKDMLRKALIDLGHDGEVDDKTIKEVAFFIDDMRLLYSIANEYHQYCLRLGCGDRHKIDNDKLLAMIVYKNYYPDSFASLPKRRGEIYDALCQEKKREYQNIALNKVLTNREELAKKKLKALQSTQHLKAKELRMIYVMAYVNKMSDGVNSIYDKPISYFWETEDAFNELISQTTIKFTYSSYYSSYLKITFSEIEKEIDPDLTYQERIDAINIGEDEINREIVDINLEKLRVRSYPVWSLIMKFSLYHEECYKQLELSEMADRFIRIGLIAEDYYDYISYFYPGMVTANDHNLILDMKLDRKPDYRTQIDNVETFLEELPDDVFLTQSIYNINLLDYLAIHPVLEKEYYSLFLHQLSVNNPFDFISIYYKEGENSDVVLTTYIQNNPHKIWNAITAAIDSSYEDIMREIWLKYCSIEQIKRLQIEWINDHFKFISTLYTILTEDKRVFLTTRVKYNTLSETATEMLGLVINNECYVVSKETLPIVFKHKDAFDDIDLLSFEEQTLALLLELPNPTWKNVSIYFKNNGYIADDSLWHFIQNKAEFLSLSIYDGEQDIENSLFQTLMGSNILSFDVYQRIGNAFTTSIFCLTDGVKDLEEERVCWLIKNGYIEYSEENIQFVQTLSYKVVYEYIVYNKSHFVSDIDKYLYSSDIVLMILESTLFSIEEKSLCITRLNASNITMSQLLADAICNVLVERSIECDFVFLMESLKEAKNKCNVLKIAISIIENNKTKHNIITELLQLLPKQYSQIGKNGKRPTIDLTPTNELLLKALMKANYISTFTSEKNVYRVNEKQK